MVLAVQNSGMDDAVERQLQLSMCRVPASKRFGGPGNRLVSGGSRAPDCFQAGAGVFGEAHPQRARLVGDLLVHDTISRTQREICPSQALPRTPDKSEAGSYLSLSRLRQDPLGNGPH
jgi:hypothetical protein